MTGSIIGALVVIAACTAAWAWWEHEEVKVIGETICGVLASRRGSQWTTRASILRWTEEFYRRQGRQLHLGRFTQALARLEDTGAVEIGRSMRRDSAAVCYVRLAGAEAA